MSPVAAGPLGFLETPAETDFESAELLVCLFPVVVLFVGMARSGFCPSHPSVMVSVNPALFLGATHTCHFFLPKKPVARS